MDRTSAMQSNGNGNGSMEGSGRPAGATGGALQSTASVCPSPHQCTISVRNVTVLTAIRATGMRAPYREHISDIACWNAPNQSITNFKFQNFGKTQTVESSAVQCRAALCVNLCCRSRCPSRIPTRCPHSARLHFNATVKIDC